MKWHMPSASKRNWKFLRSRRFWFKTVLVVLGLFITITIAGASILPGNPLYPIKRVGEALLTTITPNLSYQHVKAKEGVRAIFAARRLNEAASMVERLDSRSVNKQASDADTIEVLLQQFGEVFNDTTLSLSQTIDLGEQPSVKIFTDLQKRSAELAVKLEHLRLEAPPTDQATVLRSIVIINNNLATISDALHQAPISEADATELTKLISSGLISKSDLTALLGQANSNRRLLDLLRERVKSGQLPSGIIYAMNFDLVTKLLPDEAPTYINSVRFDELRKVALLMKTIEPTPTQKTAINQYLQSYKAGDLVPTNSLTRYTAPLIYGWHLVESSGIDLGVLHADHLSPERRIFYDLWSPYLSKTKNASTGKQSSLIIPKALAQNSDSVATGTAPTYDQVLSSANIGIIKSSTLLDRVQLELLKATRSEVSYMALPPGWTGSDVVAMSDGFKQSTEALRTNEVVQAKTEQVTTTLASVTTPLQATDSNQAVDALRADIKTQIEKLRGELIQNTYNSTFTTTNNTTVVNQNSVTNTNDIDTLRQTFNQSLTDLGTKLTTDNQAAASLVQQELADLKTATNDSLDRLKQAEGALKEQIKAQAELVSGVKKTIAGLDSSQTALESSIATARKEAADLTKSTAATLDASITNAQKLQAGNLVTLQTELADQVSHAAALELSLVSVAQAGAEQKAALQAEIDLSTTGRTALKQQITQAVADLTAAQTKNITDITTAIASSEARGATQITETKNALGELKTTQADLVKSLQSLSDDKEVLRSQLMSAIAEVKTTQDRTNAVVQKLTTDQSNLLTSVQEIKVTEASTLTALQATAAETKLLRSELTQSISDITAAQAAGAQDLHNAVLALGSQFTQSIGEVTTAQSQSKARLDLVDAKTVTLSAAIDGIGQTNTQVQTDLAGQIAQTKTLQQQMAQSLTALLQAQTQTAAEVATLKTDVTTVKQSVADIKTAQLAADTKVNGLLAASTDWSNLAASVKVDINALNQLQTNLNTDFAGKTAQLRQQFESYQAHLNDDINRLTTTTDAQILRLQQEADKLKLQLQQTQSQLQSTTPSTTTTPTTTTAPTTSTTAPTTTTPSTTVPGL